MFIHKCLYHQISENFKEWFILNHSKHNYLTRHNYNNPSSVAATNSLFIPLARTTNYGLKMLKVKGPKIWNSLPSGIRITKSPYCFKKLLKLSKVKVLNYYIFFSIFYYYYLLLFIVFYAFY